MTRHHGSPIVYGSPGQLAVLLASTTRLIEHEPDETFADAEVRQSSQQLSELIERRVARAASEATARRSDDPVEERASW